MFVTAFHSLQRAIRKRPLLFLCIAFAAAQGCYYASGVRFDASSLPWFFQYLDPELLRTRLSESLLYLHAQPPLFNLFLGVVLKALPGNEVLGFSVFYFLCGLVLYLSTFTLQTRLGVSRAVAFVTSTVFMLSPSFVLYENWLFYTFPLTAVTVAAAMCLHKALSEHHRGALWGFVWLLFCLVCTRSLFHVVYYVAVIAAVAWAAADSRKRILKVAIIPFLIILALYGKNAVLFGKFTTSTWLGMNLWTMTARNLPEDERQALVMQGRLSELSMIDRFADLEAYPAEYAQPQQYEGVPAVSASKRSTGYTNYNHLAYIRISDVYLQDALYVLRHRPSTFLIGILRSWYSYFRSSSDYVFLETNRERISGMNTLYDAVFYGKLPFDLISLRRFLPIYTDIPGRYLYLLLLIGLPALVLYGVKLGLSSPSTRRRLDRNQRIVILYICFNIFYVAFVGNALETGENNRFRFMTDPLYLVLLGLAIEHLLARRFRIARNTRGSSPVSR